MNTIPIINQISAGGVAFRQHQDQIEIVIILVGPNNRWQLPKGALNPDERIEDAAVREVREETGINASLIAPLDHIDYWFYATKEGRRARFHKIVHFFLMRFDSGDVADHDHEAEEARWVEIGQAVDMLAYESEKEIVRKAILGIESLNRDV